MKYLILFLAALPLLCSAEIYKWTDANGRVHYGDATNRAGAAEKVTVEIKSYDQVSFGEVPEGQSAGNKQVTMYATSWCTYCKQARTYFNANNIDFVEYDIEKDEQAKKNYDSLGGQGVPVITVGEAKMNGFSVSGFKRLYD